MTELLIPHDDRTGEAIAEYIRRCDILMREALFVGDEDREKFREWITGRFASGDALLLLHDAPLYTIGRYLGKRLSQMPAHVVERATKIAIQNGWTKT
jgi:hypothetical protein